MQVNIIEGHNRYENTDHLYDPLRKAFLTVHDYQKIQQMKAASKKSHVSHQINNLSYSQTLSLAQQTLIPEDVKLRPTYNYWKLPKDNEYKIVHVQKKVRQPITRQQLQRILKTQKQQQVIVYTIQSDQAKKQRDQSLNIIKGNILTKNNLENYLPVSNLQLEKKQTIMDKLYKGSNVGSTNKNQFQFLSKQLKNNNSSITQPKLDFLSYPTFQILTPGQTNYQNPDFSKPSFQIIRPNSSINNQSKNDFIPNPTYQLQRPISSQANNIKIDTTYSVYEQKPSNLVGANNYNKNNTNIEYLSNPAPATRLDSIKFPDKNQPLAFKSNKISEFKIYPQQDKSGFFDSFSYSSDNKFIERNTATPSQSKPMSTITNPPPSNLVSEQQKFRNTITPISPITPIKRQSLQKPQQNLSKQKPTVINMTKSIIMGQQQKINIQRIDYSASPSAIANTQLKKTQLKKTELIPELEFKKINQKRKSGILLTTPKYNLFSSIDEPINNCLNGKMCTCPSNSIITQKLNEISWYDYDRLQKQQ